MTKGSAVALPLVIPVDNLRDLRPADKLREGARGFILDHGVNVWPQKREQIEHVLNVGLSVLFPRPLNNVADSPANALLVLFRHRYFATIDRNERRFSVWPLDRFVLIDVNPTHRACPLYRRSPQSGATVESIIGTVNSAASHDTNRII